MSQIVVVGSGNWGQNLVRNFADLGVLSAVVEIAPEQAQKVQKQYPQIEVYQDYQQALNRDFQGVVIATPASTHYQLAMAALAAGKDVFVEKPMTLNLTEAKTLAKYAEKQSQILMVGHLLLYQPAIKSIREYLTTGKAGKIHHVATSRLKLGKVRREENVWWSFAPHDVSVVLNLLGDPSLIDVQAQGQRILQPQIEDNVHVDLSFSEGKTAHIHCSWYWPELQRNTVVIGDKQMLVYDEVAQTVTIYNKTVNEKLENVDQGSETIKIADSQPLKLECEHFLDCIRTRQQPLSNGRNGVAVVEVLAKVEECLK